VAFEAKKSGEEKQRFLRQKELLLPAARLSAFDLPILFCLSKR